ncbi:MAG: O-antigen ligase family protein [Candidatus Thiodiazotropha sp.]
MRLVIIGVDCDHAEAYTRGCTLFLKKLFASGSHLDTNDYLVDHGWSKIICVLPGTRTRVIYDRKVVIKWSFQLISLLFDIGYQRVKSETYGHIQYDTNSMHLWTFKKDNVWLTILLILPVFSDSSYGLADYFGIALPIGTGVIFRGLILIFVILYVLSFISMFSLGLVLFYFSVILAVIPGVAIGIATGSNLVTEITMMSKAIYLPTMILLFYILSIQTIVTPERIFRYLEISSYLFSAVIILPSVFNIEIKTYGDYAFGIKGFFQPGNDIGLAFGIATLASGYRILSSKFSLFLISLMCLNLYALASLGTRASLFILAFIGLTFIISVLFFRDNPTQQNKIASLNQLSSIVILATLLTSAFIYGYTSQSNYIYQSERINEITNGSHPRQDLIESGYSYIERRAPWLNLTGEGAERFRIGVATNMYSREYRGTEVDWLDSYGNYGLFYTLILFGFLIYTLYLSLRSTLYLSTRLALFSASGIFLYLSHSVIAGHAIFSATASTIVAAYIGIILYFNKYQKTARKQGY